MADGSESAQDDAPDHIVAEYPDRAFFEHREIFLHHLMSDLSAQLAGSGSGAPTCLDIGSNTGRYTDLLTKHGLVASGVDYSAELVERARIRYPDLSFEEGNAEALPYPDNSFDGAASFGVLQLLPNWQTAISEMVRVIRPGGAAILETNRAFPVAEIMLKSASYLARGTMSLKDIGRFIRAHRLGPKRPAEEGLRKFAPKHLLKVLRTLPVESVALHDPRKFGYMHDFMWAVVLQKAQPTNENSHPSLRVSSCDDCRRHGVSSPGTAEATVDN